MEFKIEAANVAGVGGVFFGVGNASRSFFHGANALALVKNDFSVYFISKLLFQKRREENYMLFVLSPTADVILVNVTLI